MSQSPRDYYDVLGVAPTASADDIKSAFRRLAKKKHPDICKEQGAEEQFKLIVEAYDVLSDPKRRATYDAERALRNWKNPFSTFTDFTPPSPKTGSNGTDSFDFSEFADFEELLNEMIRGMSAKTSEESTPAHPAQRFVSQITWKLAFHGGLVRLKVDGQPHSIRLPAGIRNGDRLKLSGALDGSELELTFPPHQCFAFRGDDLYVRYPISEAEAQSGVILKVPTPTGHINLSVPAQVKDGSFLRAKNQGWCTRGAKERTHLLVHIMVNDNEATRTRALLEQAVL